MTIEDRLEYYRKKYGEDFAVSGQTEKKPQGDLKRSKGSTARRGSKRKTERGAGQVAQRDAKRGTGQVAPPQRGAERNTAQGGKSGAKPSSKQGFLKGLFGKKNR